MQSPALDLLAIYALLIIKRTAKTINSYGRNNNFIVAPAKFVTEPPYLQNHSVVSSCNVGISMMDIFALLANIHLKMKHISIPKKYFSHIRHENYDKSAALTLKIFTCMTPR
jgi:Na+-transporting NADH:ubiquinone oxidoreductase subunit NqrE